MLLKDISFPTPQENVAFDEVLFQLADKHLPKVEYLRFWQSPVYFIVLGRIGREEEDIDLGKARTDKIPILRRTSGGGTVLLGPGCLNYALILAKATHPDLNDLRRSYEWISGKVTQALNTLGIKAVFRPISDIALAQSQQKFSGNAQRRGRTHILHHGTILYDFDLGQISRYLKMPKDQPQYRKSRPHKDFVANITVNPLAVKSALAASFGIVRSTQPLTRQEISLLKNYLK